MTQTIQSFREYHPAALLLYCSAPIFCTMITTNPMVIVLSMVCGSIVGIFLAGRRVFVRALFPIVLLFLITVLFNFLTNHNGRTILFVIGHFRFTLEALLFGLSMGGMLMGVFIWSINFTHLISSEGILALLGPRLPVVGLVLSMILKMVPETIRKYRELSDSGKALGIGSPENQTGK
ncbi:MAG: energy-coupling factor transporter transmembrane protein EcfT, partial [Clostridiales Family XIII bacterium]|nr:energy-coupling factor transporter transmembrane protein EcfT [Clostridiales Family XIII bacterium]